MFKPLSGNGRAAKRRRISVKEDSDDEFGFDAATQAALESDVGMLPFLFSFEINLPLLISGQWSPKICTVYCIQGTPRD